ncbi:hypothetical protein SALBM135S_03056 [Streptomyces alboniger]
MTITSSSCRKDMTRRNVLGAALAASAAAPLAAVSGPAWAAPARPPPRRASCCRSDGAAPWARLRQAAPRRPVAAGRCRGPRTFPRADGHRLVSRPGCPGLPGGALDAGRRISGVRHGRRPQRSGPSGAALRRPRGRSGAAIGPTTARGRVLARCAQPPGRPHRHGPRARQPRIRGRDSGSRFDTYTSSTVGSPSRPRTGRRRRCRGFRRRPALRPRLRRAARRRAQSRRRPQGTPGRAARLPRPSAHGRVRLVEGRDSDRLAMLADDRIRAGLSLDGPMEMRPPLDGDLDRPFMMMSAEFSRATHPEVAAFWSPCGAGGLTYGPRAPRTSRTATTRPCSRRWRSCSAGAGSSSKT